MPPSGHAMTIIRNFHFKEFQFSLAMNGILNNLLPNFSHWWPGIQHLWPLVGLVKLTGPSVRCNEISVLFDCRIFRGTISFVVNFKITTKNEIGVLSWTYAQARIPNYNSNSININDQYVWLRKRFLREYSL